MSEPGEIRVVLAEDHTLVRSGLRVLVEQAPDIVVVAEVSDGAAAIRAVAEHAPDVAILDISMPLLNGLEAARRIVAQHPRTHVLMLTVHRDEEYVLQAFRVGATGYLLKGAEVAEFGLAVRAVARGDTYLSPSVSRKVVDDYLERVTGGAPTVDALTPRQREVLRLVAGGASTKQAAAALGLSTKTVEAHRAQLMERLGIHDLPGLVRYALRKGLITDDR
ncbi:MAG: response regulator transcription factor [Gemmatimonadaceae bacterium]